VTPRLFALIFAFAVLAGCTPAPEPARPAFWQVTGPRGEQAWLLGTIHALPRPAAWRSPAIDKALGEADVIAVEVNLLADQRGAAQTYARLALSSGLPPLGSRIDPALRGALAARLARAGAKESDFAQTESWAAALQLARAGAASGAAENGIDRAVLRLAGDRRVIEFEGNAGQLGLFDALPEAEQRDLLNAVLREDGAAGDESTDLITAWRTGDFARIEAESHRGLLADPELREALFTLRNQAWAARITAELSAGRRPFVAVGAAHMAGDDGLAAMLRARGLTVVRVQ
jgi:uncharacterized protein YbaP (TraB family)